MAAIMGMQTGVLSDKQLSGYSKTDIQTAVSVLERQRDKYKEQNEQRQSDELDKRINNLEDRIKNLKSRINEASENGECQTCANRRYQDGSDDPGVSFKSASKISGNVESAVRGHEQEHVSRNRAKAEREGREIVYQSVMIKRGICPECGDSYVAGGETTTVTRTRSDNPVSDSPVKNKKSPDKIEKPEKPSDKFGKPESFSDKFGKFANGSDNSDGAFGYAAANHDPRFDVGLYDREVERGQFLNIIA